MDIIVNPNLLKFATRFLDRTKPMRSVSDFIVKKPLCPENSPVLQPFERCKPEKTGVSSKDISAFLNEAVNIKKLNLHGVLIIKDGRVICECNIGGYEGKYWHACHSLSKSVTATAIGMLIDEGKLSLDDKPYKILEKRVSTLLSLGYRNLTVRHLITMTSGASFAEAGTVVEKNWTRAYFESGVSFKAGQRFNYNSLNSYILSCIVKEVSGESLSQYLEKRLFAPLGINTYYWENSPEGIENGGWGLYLRREDIAKIAQLYLDNGLWNGKRIISEKWVRQATFPHIKTSSDTGDFDYGYHIWAKRDNTAFLFNGMFCQDALVLKEQRMIIVTNAGIEQLFQQSEYYKLIDKYFVNNNTEKTKIPKLNRLLKKLSGKNTFKPPMLVSHKPRFITNSCGKLFASKAYVKTPFNGAQRDTATACCGILPLAEQGLRNKYTSGIKSIALLKEGRAIYLDITEDEEILRLPIILGKRVKTILNLSGSDYFVLVSSKISKDEDDNDLLVVRLDFPEVASTRIMKLYFTQNALKVKMSEAPGMGLVRLFADSIENTLTKNKFVSDVVSIFDADGIFCKLEKRFEPTFSLDIVEH